jgi:hypothetical protein
MSCDAGHDYTFIGKNPLGLGYECLRCGSVCWVQWALNPDGTPSKTAIPLIGPTPPVDRARLEAARNKRAPF